MVYILLHPIPIYQHYFCEIFPCSNSSLILNANDILAYSYGYNQVYQLDMVLAQRQKYRSVEQNGVQR